MKDKLNIYVCENILLETKAVIEAEKYTNVTVKQHQPICLAPIAKSCGIIDEYKQNNGNAIFLSPCVEYLGNPTAGKSSSQNSCLALIAGRKYIDYLISEGSYTISPGWLCHWKSYLELWGFDQSTAQRFFHECATKITLLDTGVIPDIDIMLHDMGEYLNLPVQIIPVGLDHFRLTLCNTIHTWQLTRINIKTTEEIKQANRKLADYAMAIHLISKLTGNHNEPDTVKSILDIYIMLFGAKSIYFIQMNDGEIIDIKTNLDKIPTNDEITAWNILLENKEYISQGNGFAIAIKHNNKKVGMLIVDNIALPQYINEYINLAIGITPMCILVLENVKLEHERLNLQAIVQYNQKLESVGSLANGVAHEINNPINGIMNYAQIISDRINKEDELSTYADEIIHETERVTKIVRNLLNYSQKDFHLQSPFTINELICDTLSLINNSMTKEDIKIKVDINGNLSSINCNKQQIQQILINILTNARDAVNYRYPAFDDNKKITIYANEIKRKHNKMIEIIIEDSGLGISNEIKGRIFDPFFTTKSRATNAGLGLFISRSLILENYGEISFDSIPGEGSRFYLYLPIPENSL